MLIFDPGGDVQNCQLICVLKFIKEMKKNEDVKLGEITMLSVVSASGKPGELTVLIKSSCTPVLPKIRLVV